MIRKNPESAEVTIRRFNRIVQVERLLSDAREKERRQKKVSRNLRRKKAVRRNRISRMEDYSNLG
ncbi:MAG: hypothetical protein UR93_C0002G0037 [Berkelbacteria bacterium GW2011_GWA2_35_9]|uniref:30S ribosomal protein S21 n=1 Tax=Berkelbacteria bacterium GW2011_GWA2_35_9 TaxID=1618333 RepID=A0A0G0FNZ7_9BACT|nr:MAG: hypothetical protein UR93_C0002G0037 [Berkelbacteria bacterium GW2011_GWA2_35_9]